MICNVGNTEQIVRIIIGTIIVLLGLAFRSWWGLIGLLGIATGLLRYCPVSNILGISTCEVRDKK
ncbi:DUF2892 domain-containing protein [Desulfosporosinus sp. FKB]|uniref:YgaP family membrane protein n=1 Tax=Desulfosporosinus sp. FKB TaxID=1969835 RepID=UPI000B49F80F|nr:DUF2892 domain-containing protein [Desulfosporosinus sp. FKB]